MTLTNEDHPLAQWLRHVADNLDCIFVRRHNAETGRWENKALSSLSIDEAFSWVAIWCVEDHMPVAAPCRLVERDE